jgi:hypothetical protein
MTVHPAITEAGHTDSGFCPRMLAESTMRGPAIVPAGL